jgi:carbonic anhydrase
LEKLWDKKNLNPKVYIFVRSQSAAHMKPKIITRSLLGALLILLSCQTPGKENKPVENSQKDSLEIHKHPPAGAQLNEVKSEAPDASTKTEKGYAMPSLGDGLAQSPINILSTYTEQKNDLKIPIAFNDDINAVENLGHTIQLDFTGASAITIDGKSYRFRQLHFHTPSEHLIDGMTFPMEMHVVSIAQNQKDSTKPEYFVVGMFFKMGRENKFIREFLDSVPAEENKKVALRTGVVKLVDLFSGIPKKDLEAYYHYRGSLTTPPYTETVNWIIKKYIFEASPEQIAAIEKTEGDNARHVRALYSRKVAGE